MIGRTSVSVEGHREIDQRTRRRTNRRTRAFKFAWNGLADLEQSYYNSGRNFLDSPTKQESGCARKSPRKKKIYRGLRRLLFPTRRLRHLDIDTPSSLRPLSVQNEPRFHSGAVTSRLVIIVPPSRTGFGLVFFATAVLYHSLTFR